MNTKGMVYVSISTQCVLKFTLKGELLGTIGTEKICHALILLGFALIPMIYSMFVTLYVDHYIKAYTTEGQYLGKLCC